MTADEFLEQAKAQLKTHGLPYEGPIVGVLTNMAMAVEEEGRAAEALIKEAAARAEAAGLL